MIVFVSFLSLQCKLASSIKLIIIGNTNIIINKIVYSFLNNMMIVLTKFCKVTNYDWSLKAHNMITIPHFSDLHFIITVDILFSFAFHFLLSYLPEI